MRGRFVVWIAREEHLKLSRGLRSAPLFEQYFTQPNVKLAVQWRDPDDALEHGDGLTGIASSNERLCKGHEILGPPPAAGRDPALWRPWRRPGLGGGPSRDRVPPASHGRSRGAPGRPLRRSAFGPLAPLPVPSHGTPRAINDAKGAIAT